MKTHIIKGIFTIGIKDYGEYTILVSDIIEKFVNKYCINVEPIGFDCFVTVTSDKNLFSSCWTSKTAVKYHFRDEATKSKFLLIS